MRGFFYLFIDILSKIYDKIKTINQRKKDKAMTLFSDNWIEIIGTTEEKDNLILIWRNSDRTKVGTMTVTKLLEIVPVANHL